MISFILFVLLFLFIGFCLICLSTNRSWIRQKTAREEVLHDQIQRAMNWEPEHFHQREDGRWFNAYGEEGVHMTLEEFMEHYKKGDKS